MIETKACNFIKNETLVQVFSCELPEISKNTFSYWTPPLSASEIGSFQEYRGHLWVWELRAAFDNAVIIAEGLLSGNGKKD